MPQKKKTKPETRKAFVLINTNDMDCLDVEVFDTPDAAIEHLKGELDSISSGGAGDYQEFADEAGEPIEPRLNAWVTKAWTDEEDLDVWCDEGRVIFTLKVKEVRS